MKTHITLITFLLVASINAQDFQGKAIYKTHQKTAIKFGGTGAPNPELEKKMAERMKKMFQKTFILNFNKNESVYKEDAKLDAPRPQANGMNIVVMGSGANDVFYKNIRENRFASKTEIMGKPFLIKDSIPKIEWELTGETKNIGTYTCYKATYTREEESVNISTENGEIKETKEMLTKITTAWYTPQIPVSNGPEEFGGLPGLILEINDGKLTIVCSEIVLNPSDKIEIKEPTKGKEISQKDFDKLQKEKSKEMMERFRSKRGDGKGNTIEIKIGG